MVCDVRAFNYIVKAAALCEIFLVFGETVNLAVADQKHPWG